MKPDPVDSQIKALLETYTATVEAEGPKYLFVKVKNVEMVGDLIAAMKARGWSLDEEDYNETRATHFSRLIHRQVRRTRSRILLDKH